VWNKRFIKREGNERVQQEETSESKKGEYKKLAPLTGIALAINWLIDKLNLKIGVVKTTRMTTSLL